MWGLEEAGRPLSDYHESSDTLRLDVLVVLLAQDGKPPEAENYAPKASQESSCFR